MTGTPRDEDPGADTDDLRRSLAALSGLVAGSMGLERLLGVVASYAADAIPGADGAGVTLLRSDTTLDVVEARAASHPFVDDVDEIQYAVVKEGPCITAARERRTVRTGSLDGGTMWPRFGPRVGRLGVHSALSIPLLLAQHVVGAINVYAFGPDVFDDHAQRQGELFAAPAAVAVHNAYTLSQALSLAEQLQQALASRPVIDEAVGLIRSRTGATSDEALERLRTMSRSEHVSVTDVAERLLDQAVRRARARHPDR